MIRAIAASPQFSVVIFTIVVGFLPRAVAGEPTSVRPGTQTIQTRQSPPADSARVNASQWLSPAAVEMLVAISDGYMCRGKKIASNNDTETIQRLTRSDDAAARGLAEMTQQLAQLQVQDEQQRRQTNRLMQQGAKNLQQSAIGGAVRRSLKDDDAPDVSEAARNIQDSTGDTQTEINKCLKIECQLMELKNSFYDKVRSLADSATPKHPSSPGAISATLVTNAQRLGQVIITNRTKQDLTHCVIITRTVMDKKRMTQGKDTEAAFGERVLPRLGFSESFAKESVRSSKLRRQLFSYDQGTLVYVPEILAGGTVQMAVCDEPRMLLAAERAELSVWSDQLAVESQTLKNIADVQRALQQPRQKSSKAKSTAPRSPTKRPKTSGRPAS